MSVVIPCGQFIACCGTVVFRDSYGHRQQIASCETETAAQLVAKQLNGTVIKRPAPSTWWKHNDDDYCVVGFREEANTGFVQCIRLVSSEELETKVYEFPLYDWYGLMTRVDQPC